MKHEPTPLAAAQIPLWHTPADARSLLDAQIGAFVAAAARYDVDSETDAPAMAMKVTAGLGKTATTLRMIARHADALLARGHVLIYVPTLDLAERAWGDFRRLAPRVPSRVVRGRAALRPDDPKKKKQMCEKAELAHKISGFVPSVTQALCRAEDPDGNFVLSDCAAGGPYLAQKDVPGARVVFLSHAYLLVNPPIDRDVRIALRVVDEKAWPTLARTAHVSIDDVMQVPPPLYPADLRDDLARAKGAIIDGLQRNIALHDHMKASGPSQDALERLAAAEGKSQSRLEIGPWQSAETVSYKLTTFDAKSFIASRGRQSILSRAAEKDAGHCNSLFIAKRPVGAATPQFIEMSFLEQLPRDAPVLLLDADADPDITERLAPGAVFRMIESPPVADIVQASDLTLSTTWLLDKEHGAARRAGILQIIKREVARADGGGVLVVATKKVLWQLHADTGHHFSEANDKAMQQDLLGAVPRWFGPRMQGLNDFEGFATVIIVGRLQPPVADVEAATRGVFGKDEMPVHTHSQGALPAVDTQILMSDGTLCEAVTRAHPDPRAQTIMAQTRECGTLQAIARLRLVAPDRAKRVVILSNLPLPGFPVTRLVPFEAIRRGLENEVDLPGYLRLEAALRATMGRTVLGTRLSAAGLASDLPLDFCSESAGRSFRRGRPTAALILLCQRIAAANGWPISILRLRKSTGGIPMPAIVLAPPPLALALAGQLWPGSDPVLAE